MIDRATHQTATTQRVTAASANRPIFYRGDGSARSFAVITLPLCRAAVARLLRAQFSDVAVLSFLEIPETKRVDVIGGMPLLEDASPEIGEPHVESSPQRLCSPAER